jgi:hypothetical protein
MMMRKSFVWAGVTALVMLSGVAQRQSLAQAPAAQGSTDQDVALLRKDIQSQKKQIVAANLTLTDAEATKFWPVYDQYEADLVKINDAKYAAIKSYAESYDTLTDAKALELTKQIIGVDQSVAQLRLKYAPMFANVVSGKKTALFFQLDRRLVMLVDLQIAAAIPMVQP